jgi:hypothetical protein
MVPQNKVHHRVCDILAALDTQLKTIKRVCANNPKFIEFLDEKHRLLSNIVNNLEELKAHLREQPKEASQKNNYKNMP